MNVPGMSELIKLRRNPIDNDFSELFGIYFK
jgi:hypothetical protein